MSAKIGQLNPAATGAEKGATLADGVLAGLLPCVPDALTEMAAAIQSSLEATGDLMDATGTLYHDTEDGNVTNAALLASGMGE